MNYYSPCVDERKVLTKREFLLRRSVTLLAQFFPEDEMVASEEVSHLLVQ
jgi:hypothetical protein